MSPTDFVQDLLPRLEAKMIGVVEAKVAARLRELGRGEPLKRGLCRYGHEDG